MDSFTAAAAKTVDGVVGEIMRMHKSLPPRPDIEEVEAATTLIRNIEREDQVKLEAIFKQTKGKAVPEELFFLYQEMQKSLVHFQSREQKREAVKLLDLENAHNVFDEMIQRVSQCISPNSDSGQSSSLVKNKDLSVSQSGFVKPRGLDSSVASSSFYNLEKKEPVKNELFTRDDSYVMKSKAATATFHVDGFDSTLKISNYSGKMMSPLYFSLSLIMIFICCFSSG